MSALASGAPTAALTGKLLARSLERRVTMRNATVRETTA
jgi:hypothetical protein